MTNKKRQVVLPAEFDAVADILGLDSQGCVVIRFGTDHTMVLTPCCHASGKGSADSISGVVCRACYRDVPIKHGGIDAEIVIARADLDIVVADAPARPTETEPERG
ncbi:MULTISPECIES: hypothetical protein [Nocardia]|uniref:hypothetical protein n=1 Tax=Nocardia TaxID=1817 RepID=UPI00030542E7|nr:MULTISPECIES: hypothetical protein [Nocardia]